MENRELEITVFTSTWFHVVAGPAQQLLQHTHGVLGLLPPRLGQSRGRRAPAARAARSLPGGKELRPARCPAEPRQSGSEGHVVKKVQLFSLIVLFSADSCCFLLL